MLYYIWKLSYIKQMFNDQTKKLELEERSIFACETEAKHPPSGSLLNSGSFWKCLQETNTLAYHAVNHNDQCPVF